MNPITRQFTLLTCGFPHGAYQSQHYNRPDLRSPSVKGQLRWWYDALFSDIIFEHRLFPATSHPVKTATSAWRATSAPASPSGSIV